MACSPLPQIGCLPRQMSQCAGRVSSGFTAADGAFHVAIPLRGALGAGPVDAPDRRAPRLAVGRPDSRSEVRAVAAAGELLGRPDGDSHPGGAMPTAMWPA
jgi:hypothetical protein